MQLDGNRKRTHKVPRRPEKARHVAISLGGHLKTGHRRTLQNRPMERNQNKTIYTLQEGARANIFVGLGR
jgi:hypothetical protein